MIKSIHVFTALFLLFTGCQNLSSPKTDLNKLLYFEKDEILLEAENYLDSEPITVTSWVCERSEGGVHDFYSEGDYWWPDTINPEGPYIRRDGLTNPDNFTHHREVMVRLSRICGTLASAYRITSDEKYLQAIIPHIKAWFIAPDTRMNPSLNYAQAIKGRVSGRGIGIIDTIHLLEVVRAIQMVQATALFERNKLDKSLDWFQEYLEWLTTHPFGIAERDNGNNHSTTWAMQVAAFAALINDTEKLDYCRNLYKEVLLPQQMDSIGGFPLELARTKPYGYSLFNMDAMATLCQVLSTQEDNLFNFVTPDGKSLKKGVEFIYPFVKNKDSWPYTHDVLYWDKWPARHSFLLFAGLQYNNPEYLEQWRKLKTDTSTFEVLRNMPIRNGLIWVP